ncbi:MAG TPA: hypothetical protein VH951_07195 [Dehalococcoidia bacterium]|jgi:hypothetical protein
MSEIPKSAAWKYAGLVACAVLCAAVLACAGGGNEGGAQAGASPTASITPRPTSTATPQSEGFRQQAERTQLPRMSVNLAGLVRQQPWFNDMSADKLALVTMLLKCEQAAIAHGENTATADALQFASEQGWYGDGLDDHEAKALSEVFDAFALSFTKPDAPPVGSVLSTTLKNQTFDVVNLPETGDKVIIVASKDAALGRKTLQIAIDNLPKIEGVAGRFPYPFIYIEVTPDFPPELGGVSYDEFIGINSKDANTEVISHELTHSTVYGIFPTWFEEGVAYFMGHYMANDLDAGTRSAMNDLRGIKADNKVDIGMIGLHPGLYSDWDYFAETRRGFLFVKSIFDIEGIDGLSATIKALRTKTYGDNDLLAAILKLAPQNLQDQLRKLYCDRVVGGTHNYCASGG